MKMKASEDCIRDSKRRHAYEVHKLLPQRNPKLLEDLFKEIEDVFLVKNLKKEDQKYTNASSC